MDMFYKEYDTYIEAQKELIRQRLGLGKDGNKKSNE